MDKKPNFYRTTASNEVDQIKDELLNNGFTECEPCGESNALFIDTINKTFWECDEQRMEANRKLALELNGEEPQIINLKEIQQWK